MSTDPAIRRATDADWDRIWPIWHSVVEPGDTFTYDPATTSDQAKAGWLGDPAGEVWIASTPAADDPDPADDSASVGVYRVAPNQGGPGSHVVNGSYMVAEHARGQGIGRALVTHSLARSAQLGYLGMQFNAVAATNIGALGLYRSLGFAAIGRVPGGFRHPRAGRVDLIMLYREL